MSTEARRKRRARRRIRNRILAVGAIVVLGAYGVALADLRCATESIQVMQTDTLNMINEMWLDVDSVKKEVEEADRLIVEELGEFKISAYCACKKCCGKTNGITATGAVATAGRTIAVDPKVIPYGSEVIVGNRVYVAEDCGGAHQHGVRV